MTQLTAGHRLLPHEYGLAMLVLRRNAEHRSPSVLRHEQRLGRDGIVIAAAGLTNLLAAELLVLAGIALITFAGQLTVAVAVGLTLFALAAGAALLTVLRLRQARTAGRAFRGDR
ncbi:MAG TPA: hypothetical protein VHO01_00035 [Jatrophihabitans sp.]|nr:hypothetical protein [Jatrophihabitans sp.]